MLKIYCLHNKKAIASISLLPNAISIFMETFPCCSSRVYSTTTKLHLFIEELINKRSRKLISQRFFATSGSKNLYEILEVSQNASQSELKSAFYKLSKKYHPDVVGSSESSTKKFVEISNAYETLKDDKKRREYDRQLAGGFGPTGDPSNREGPTWSTDFHPQSPFKQQSQQWEKEWKWQFGGSSDRHRRRPFSPFDDIFGNFGGPPPPPPGSSPFQRWQWDQGQQRKEWVEWQFVEELEKRKREERELNELWLKLRKEFEEKNKDEFAKVKSNLTEKEWREREQLLWDMAYSKWIQQKENLRNAERARTQRSIILFHVIILIILIILL